MAMAIYTVIFFQLAWILQICNDFQANLLLKMLPKTLTLLSELSCERYAFLKVGFLNNG
jgi:hypothetical protein